MDIEECLEYAKIKHEGQKRRNGEPYIEHPKRVADYLKNKGFGIEYQITGLFHDLLEDTDAQEEDILALSNDDVLTAVRLLTKRKGLSSEEYIRDILENPLAKEVKTADRIDNLKDALEQDTEFIRRYLEDTKSHYFNKFSDELDKAYEKLKEKLQSIEDGYK